MLNESKRILAKLANPEEREERLQLLLSFPSDSPDRKVSSGDIARVIIPGFEWANRSSRLGEEERA